MRWKLPATTLLTMALSSAALADHNSKWGAGWANMPNDIHNTRIDTRDDNDVFRDFVRYGNGAESENRFEPNVSGARNRTVRSDRQSSAMSRSTMDRSQRSMRGGSRRGR